MRGEHAVIPMAMPARGRYQGRQLVEELHGFEGRAPEPTYFCGTAKVACEWVRRGRGRTAVGVDRDPAVLAWDYSTTSPPLPRGAARRIALVEGDVLTVRLPPVDLVLAMNFSYWVFKERTPYRGYTYVAPGGL